MSAFDIPIPEFFLRGLGVIYFLAFFSLWRELLGLYGHKGIVPIAEYIARLKHAHYSFWKAPTLFWITSSDAFLQTAAISGMLLAGLVIFGVFTSVALLLLFFLYLSFCTVGSPFLDFQWDRLLLESGIYAFFFACGPSFEEPMTWSFYFLLFRLMLSSAIVKLTAVTDHWRNGYAMDYHYESQPLPNAPAFFIHQQPKWFSTFSVYAMLFVEMVVPWAIFLGAVPRAIAFFILLGFQWLLMLTGNFAFFNLLSIVISFLLLGMPKDMGSPFAWAIGSFFIALNIGMLAHLFNPALFPARLYRWIAVWGISSSYGLFANMTKGRYEIVIEGSSDGDHWIPYEFFYKPQALNKVPSQIAPLQPRLEWQLWFIPSVPWRHVGWFVNLLERLLEGSKPVLALFKYNPFPQEPPKYVRALIYAYKFSDLKTWRQTGHFWTRVFKGAYTPPIHLTENRPK